MLFLRKNGKTSSQNQHGRRLLGAIVVFAANHRGNSVCVQSGELYISNFNRSLISLKCLSLLKTEILYSIAV